MAVTHHVSASVQSGFNARFNALVLDVKARLARRRVFKNTYRELAVLSDRELTDLGLNRTEIRRIAWQAAYDV